MDETGFNCNINQGEVVTEKWIKTANSVTCAEKGKHVTNCSRGLQCRGRFLTPVVTLKGMYKKGRLVLHSPPDLFSR